MAPALNISFYNQSTPTYYNESALRMNASSPGSGPVVVTMGGISMYMELAAVNITSHTTGSNNWYGEIPLYSDAGTAISTAKIIGNQTVFREALGMPDWAVSAFFDAVGVPFITIFAISPTQNDQCSKSSLCHIRATLLFTTMLEDVSRLTYKSRG